MTTIPVACDEGHRLRRVPLAELRGFQGELKSLGQTEHNKLRDSMLENGFIAPVYIWTNGNRILDGHQRVKVLNDEQMEVEGGVPVVDIYAADEEDAAEKLLLISSAYGKVEPAGLYDFTTAHGITIDADSLDDLPNFDKAEYLENYYPAPAIDKDPDEVPEAPPEVATLRGDLYILGEHRLLCGDCTDPEEVARLMDGRRADVGVTSPPYAVGKEYEVDVSFGQHVELLESMADRALEAIAPGGFFFVNFGEIAAQSHAAPLTGSDRQCLYLISKDYWRIFHEERGCDLYAQRVWYKPFNRLQQPFWSYKTSIPHYQEFEHIWTWRLPGGGGDARHDWDISVRAVWDTRDEATDDRPLTRHVAAFPVGIPERALKAHSGPGALVWEPFSGSGTTIVAAERLGRLCYAMEIDPTYVDVCVQRWQNYTGKVAMLEDGTPYDEAKNNRLVAQPVTP